MLAKSGIKAKGISQYRYEFMKALLTYKLNKERFEELVNKTGVLYQRMVELLQENLSEGFEKDPYDMTEEEFSAYYDKLEKTYLTGYAVDYSEEPAEEKKKKEVKVEKKAKENIIDSIDDLPESYSSIDRILSDKSPKKKVQQDVDKLSPEEKQKLYEDCEKVSKEHLESLYESIDSKLEQESSPEKDPQSNEGNQ